jgi:hypothetical protein
MLIALVLSAVSLVSGDRRDPDLVVLKGGEEVECRVLYEDDAEVVYSVKRKEKRTPRTEVESVQSVERSLREFLTRFEKASSTDVAAMSELALFCEQSFLPGEARNLWIRVIALDPENEQAWTKLGGVKGRKGWQLQVRGRFYDLEELKERASDWKNALELSTAHFLIKTDGDPVRALDASIDIERAYQAFYDVIGKPLKLYVFDEEPEIDIFSDPKDYPSPPGQGQMVWFNRGANTLNVSATSQTWLGDVVSELTQCLIFNAFRRSADSKTGEIEPWAQQGFMSAFAAAVRPDPGRVAFEFEPPYRPWFEKQARDAKPLDLERILTSGRGSYEGGPDAERYAIGAYTLVHFLVFSQNGKYRPALANFLRDSFLGKGGKTQFLSTLGVKADALESEWRNYIKSVSGT